MDGNEIRRTAVIGSGTMAAGLVQILAQAGCRVYLVGRSDGSMQRCLQRVRDGLLAQVNNGLLGEGEIGPILSRVEPTTSLERAASDVQFALETVIEDLAVKQRIFADLDRFSPRDALLATNTSGMRVGDIAERTEHPDRVLGSHFFYPPAVVPVVEVGYGRKTSDDTIETAVAFWKRCGKEPVVVRKDINGFLVTRMQAALTREAISLVENGVAGPEDVDRALKWGFGLRIPLTGILEQRDWGGLDVHMAASASIYPTLDDTKGPMPLIIEKVGRGETGAKSGKGFYDWTGKDIEALRVKRQEQLLRLVQALKEITAADEDLVENA